MAWRRTLGYSKIPFNSMLIAVPIDLTWALTGQMKGNQWPTAHSRVSQLTPQPPVPHYAQRRLAGRCSKDLFSNSHLRAKPWGGSPTLASVDFSSNSLDLRVSAWASHNPHRSPRHSLTEPASTCRMSHAHLWSEFGEVICNMDR